MVDNGWIKLHRKFLKWEWYTDVNTKAVFLHLLLNANYEERKWRGTTIEVGEVVTSVKSLSRDLKLTTQQTRTALERLKSTNEITIKTTNKYSVIKVCNYGIYQEFGVEEQQTKQQAEQQTSNKQVTNKQQTNNKQITTPKEIKNIRNKEIQEIKKKDIYGEFDNVTLTQDEFDKLINEYGTDRTMKAIELLGSYKIEKGYATKSDYLTMKRWVFKSLEEREQRQAKFSNTQSHDFMDDIKNWVDSRTGNTKQEEHYDGGAIWDFSGNN